MLQDRTLLSVSAKAKEKTKFVRKKQNKIFVVLYMLNLCYYLA